MQNKGNARSAGEQSKSTPYPLEGIDLNFTMRHNGCTSALADTGQSRKSKAHLYHLRVNIYW
jgi:hypothetical protein